MLRLLKFADVGMEGGEAESFSLMALEPWKLMLIFIAAAIVLGVIIGVMVGKYQVKRASSDYKPLLSLKERIIYVIVFAVGAGCLLFGVFYTFPTSQNPGIVDEGMMNPGMEDGVRGENPDGTADIPEGGGKTEEPPATDGKNAGVDTNLDEDAAAEDGQAEDDSAKNATADVDEPANPPAAAENQPVIATEAVPLG